jgi:ATP/maltotriose-dependent transcriptional regulator MalT
LLQTSVLEWLQGSLCDAVTGTTGGKATLEALDRQNLFVIPLDDRRERYRYHHLFADVLRARLLEEDPDAPADLHRRASVWYADHGEPSDAVRHAISAGDFAGAAALAEMALPAMRRDRHDASIREWAQVVPEDVVRVRPVLIVGFVGAAMSAGEVEGVDVRLDEAEQWLALAPEPCTRQRLAQVFILDRIKELLNARWRQSVEPGDTPGPETMVGKLHNTTFNRELVSLLTEVLGPRLAADTGAWGAYAWAEFALSTPGARIGGGTEEIVRNTVAERVLGLPKEPKA